jgi:NAD(P)-dependent dehydrogenase (short-subunit alcohol dehydrogenase family)
MNLKHVRAVVTGGTSGLGRATVKALVDRGGRVTIVGRDLSRGNLVCQEASGSTIFVRADVTDPEAVEAALCRASEAFGCPNVLVNCAGIANACKTVGRSGPADLAAFLQVVGVNLVGTFNCIRLAAARMARSEPDATGERGVVVNTASIAAFDGQMGQAAYAASKGGVTAMTLPIARDLAQFGIRVVTIAPGLFETPMIAPLPHPVRTSLHEHTPFPSRFGEPDEFASLVIHVLQNQMLNGATIRLDGGLRLGGN